MFKEAITSDLLKEQNRRRGFARLLESGLQVNAAFCGQQTLSRARATLLVGKAKPVTIGAVFFPSRAAAEKRLRAVRDGHPDGEAFSSRMKSNCLPVWSRPHPQRGYKVGPGVAGFFAAKAPEYPTRCFYIRRVDGSTTDISWHEAIKPATSIKKLRAACRNAILRQKLTFRDMAWPPGDASTRICPITGLPFARSEAHVDHTPPQTLAQLVDDWLENEGISVSDVPLDETGDMKSADTFESAAQNASWLAFHASHAQLRLISAEGNLRQGNRVLEE
jgi:hypothetical protein